MACLPQPPTRDPPSCSRRFCFCCLHMARSTCAQHPKHACLTVNRQRLNWPSASLQGRAKTAGALFAQETLPCYRRHPVALSFTLDSHYIMLYRFSDEACTGQEFAPASPACSQSDLTPFCSIVEEAALHPCPQGQFYSTYCFEPTCFSNMTAFYFGSSLPQNSGGFCQSCSHCSPGDPCEADCDVVNEHPPHDLQGVEMFLGLQIQSTYNPTAPNTTSPNAWGTSKLPSSSDVAYFPGVEGQKDEDCLWIKECQQYCVVRGRRLYGVRDSTS